MFKKIIPLLLIILVSCSARREYIMPFNNYVYDSVRLFPIQSSDAENIVRIWINNGTSIDRIITISKDSIFQEQAFLTEISLPSKKTFFNRKEIVPKSGIAAFLEKIDSLDLFQYESQTDFSFALHEPFSIYVIEQKKNDKYHQFNFKTSFTNENEDQYTNLEKLIMEEFLWEFYIK